MPYRESEKPLEVEEKAERGITAGMIVCAALCAISGLLSLTAFALWWSTGAPRVGIPIGLACNSVTFAVLYRTLSLNASTARRIKEAEKIMSRQSAEIQERGRGL